MKANTSHTLKYGSTNIAYELCRTPRKSLEISVYPDKRIFVKAPVTTSFEVIEQRIQKRALWIKKQLAFFEQFSLKTPERQYVGGESHLYLGRKYRLKIESSDCNSISLKNGYFFIKTRETDALHMKPLLDSWYCEHAYTHFTKIFEKCWTAFTLEEVKKPVLKLQIMKTRWGSLSKNGRLTLNTYLIRAPKECIEYVITHELCHLAYHNHNCDFYALLARKMPDWTTRKHKLEMSLI